MSGGAGDDRIDGGAGNDSLIGGAGNDAMIGGAGADTLVGGVGNDTYYVDVAGDVITELVGEGTDIVYSTSTSYTLGANVENLTLAGVADISGTGNTLNNALTGNAGVNTLSGGAGDDTLSGAAGDDILAGGDGNDLLGGGAGNDLFVFNVALNAATNTDTVADFGAGDKMVLDHTIFAALGAAGQLDAGLFHSGAGVTGGTGVGGIYYDTSSGAMYYDSDGVGSSASIKFAMVSGKIGLTAIDFNVI
jgi:Ca2+-binding RTX toxin-like protein